MTFTRELVGSIYYHLSPDRQVRRCMIQHIRRPFSKNGVALRIRVGTKSEQYFARVVNIHIGIHDDDVFGKHHLAHSPESVHDLESLQGIGLPDADENQVVKHAFGWQSNVHYLWKVHFENWQKKLH